MFGVHSNTMNRIVLRRETKAHFDRLLGDLFPLIPVSSRLRVVLSPIFATFTPKENDFYAGGEGSNKEVICVMSSQG